jgi:hypothetical protein
MPVIMLCFPYIVTKKTDMPFVGGQPGSELFKFKLPGEARFDCIGEPDHQMKG